MASSGMLKVTYPMILLSMVILAHHASARIPSCNSVYTSLYPCLNYVRSGGEVPPACCNGVKSVLASATTKADRQSVCSCLKAAAAAFPGADLTYATMLPGKCGVSIPYKINPNVDCSKVK